MQGILASQTLFATHYQFLNDKQEAVLLHLRMQRYIQPHIKKAILELAKFNTDASEYIKKLGGASKAAEQEAAAICRSFHKITFDLRDEPNFHEPFISSFCGHTNEYEKENGLLSQWRGYGQKEGYAIAFDTIQLTELLKKEGELYAYNGASISDVVYDGDEEGFNNEFKELIDCIPEVIPKTFFSNIPSWSPFINNYLRSVTRFKHRGFEEEKEVRVVVPPISDYWSKKLKTDQPKDYEKSIFGKKIKPVLFRNNFIPYIEIGDPEIGRLPIKYIIVGPNAAKEQRCSELEKFLGLLGLKIEVKVSETPLG